MIRCLNTELWKAFHNKMFWSALLIGLFLSAVNIVHNIITVNSFTKIWLQMINEDWAVSKSYEGFSLFTKWLAVNTGSLGSNLFNILWPILAAMPFGWSYSVERRGGYINQIISRVNSLRYFIAKYSAIFISGGLMVMIPMMFDLLINALICPVYLPDVTTSILPIFNMTFLSRLYYTMPWAHALLWCVVKFLWGGVAASVCWIVGTKCRYQTVVILIPFGMFMLMDVVSDLYCNITCKNQGFSPMLLSQTATGSSTSGLAIFFVIGSITVATIIAGYRQVVKCELV